MQRSTDRILTTHVGSLPRPADLLDVVLAKDQGKPVDEKAHATRLRAAVGEVVRQQVELGIDIIDDGEFGKPSFVSYVNDRLGGFEVDKSAPRRSSWAGSREARSFPEFYADANVSARIDRRACKGPVSYRGMAQLQTDIDNLKAALDGLKPAQKPEEVFMPAISPTSAADWLYNGYYKTEEEYLFAIADALREEYEAIVKAGFLLQVDDPHLVTYWIKEPDLTLAQCRKWAEVRVEALNHALRNIPTEKIRYHTCYSINMVPRVHDMEVRHLIDILMKVRAGAFSFEASNPRHEHEWTVWRDAKLPEGTVLIPGVITNSSVLVEHPELVAQRIVRFADFMGRENVIAGTDCGFATFAGSDEVHASIVWAKLEALARGAEIASKQLWGR
jgi:5-methyltetrahydropteroyltriglutamate--homocysteine methyltransferase